MKKNYFTPETKVITVNLNNSIMEENVETASLPPASDEPVGAPMF